MHGYDGHEVIYLNCEINGPWVSGSGQRVGPIWYSENVLNLRKVFLSSSKYILDKLNAWL